MVRLEPETVPGRLVAFEADAGWAGVRWDLGLAVAGAAAGPGEECEWTVSVQAQVRGTQSVCTSTYLPADQDRSHAKELRNVGGCR